MTTQNEPTHWRLLKILKEKEGTYSTGPALAEELGISRTAVWKHVKRLQSDGYHMETHPKAGYRLVAVPDRLIPQEIVPDLETTVFGRPYYHFPSLSSTNDHLLSLAARGAPHGTTVVAEEQTQGRGRLRRPWLSVPSRGIYVSILLRTQLPVHDAPQSTLLASLALTKVLRRRYGLPASLKWPNDVLVRHRKAAGILTEMQSDQEVVRFLVMGIGINVNHSAEELQGPFRYPATSLALEYGGQMRRQEVLLAFLHQFEKDYERFLGAGFEALLPQLEEASGILGKTITVHCGDQEHSGKALGLTQGGALKLLTTQKTEVVIWAGDVTRVEGIEH